MVMSCQPFTEVENEEFRDLLSYLKPFLKDMNQADAMRTKILAQSAAARKSLQKILKVSYDTTVEMQAGLTCVHSAVECPKWHPSDCM